MNNLHTIDIAVIIGYLILCLAIGLYKAGQIKTIREYTLGTGHVSTAVLLFTIFATHVGAGATIGVVEKVHSMGLIFAITLLAQPLFWLITTKIFAGNIDVFKNSGCMSVSDVMQLLYGKPGKWITNVVSILFSTGIIALQIGAIGYLFNYFLGISHLQGAVLGFSVLVMYSLFGGIRAVALTDTFQGLILLIAIPIACVIAFHEVGGYDILVQNLPITHISITFSKENIILLAGMLFFTLMPLSEGTFMQRYLMANNSEQLTKALRIITLISLPVASVIYLIGFIIKVKAPEINPNTAFFYLISNYLPVGVTGLLISGILAAIMSTADSWLNNTSVLCAHDIAKGLFPKLTDKQELFIARISVLIISGSSAILALTTPSLMSLLWMAGNFWFPIILIPMAAGFLNFQTNQRSFIASTVCGTLGIMLGRYITGELATISLLLGALSSATGLFGMHYWQVLTHQDTSNVKLPKYAQLSNTKVKKKYFSAFIKQTKCQATRYKVYAHLLGGLGMIYFLGSSFFMAFTDMKVLYTIVYMKAAAAILCFGLCIHDFHLTPKQQKRYMPIYWNLTLLYCFTFLSAYIALIYDGSMPWMVNLMLSMILLYVFGGWITVILLSVIGFAIAYLLFKVTGYNLAIHAGDQPKMLGYIYCLLTGAIILILKQKDILQEKELQTKVLYGTAVAHEVANPLQGSAMMADVLINTFENKTHPSQITQEELDDIKSLLHPFKESSIAALKTIDRMLILVRTDISEADDMGIYDINNCVEGVLKTYGFSKNKLSQMKVRKANSFKFKGSKHFVGHVINNLISNSLKYAGPGSKITIWYEGMSLHFADNGLGIAPDKLPFIFEPFDKKGSTQGTGVGLAFCKRVMESMGGSIECISGLGKGTEFVLRFVEA